MLAEPLCTWWGIEWQSGSRCLQLLLHVPAWGSVMSPGGEPLTRVQRVKEGERCRHSDLPSLAELKRMMRPCIWRLHLKALTVSASFPNGPLTSSLVHFFSYVWEPKKPEVDTSKIRQVAGASSCRRNTSSVWTKSCLL